jgi:NAD(P)-dependent dehydrogenase (short-subunit alcohol dehydrogenase family)
MFFLSQRGGQARASFPQKPGNIIITASVAGHASGNPPA